MAVLITMIFSSAVDKSILTLRQNHLGKQRMVIFFCRYIIVHKNRAKIDSEVITESLKAFVNLLFSV